MRLEATIEASSRGVLHFAGLAEAGTEADFHALLPSLLSRAVLGGIAVFRMQEMEVNEEGNPPSEIGPRG
jgi:hypothetical protein